jgi:hypothetical protein
VNSRSGTRRSCTTRKLEDQVTAQLAGQAGRNPGRHRFSAGGGQQISDASRYNLKPRRFQRHAAAPPRLSHHRTG